MDEAVVADEDAHVGERLSVGVEKHQVPRSQFIPVDGAGDLGNLGCIVGQPDARNLLEYVADHPAAVEAGFRVVAAKAVLGLDQAEGVEDHFLRLGVIGDHHRCTARHGPRHGLSGRCRGAAGNGKQEQEQPEPKR